jgi:transketolase
MTELYDCRDAFENKLRELAAEESRIVAVVNDSVGSSKLNQFGQMYPVRLVNVGIAEQNMIGVGAGLANGGLIPFVCGASPFLTGRALEQIKADLAYSNANVKLCGMSSGMAYGELGPTHHSIEDMAWLRAIANMTVIVPADPVETAQVVEVAVRTEGPMFIRLSRLPVPIVHPPDYHYEIGKAALLRDGDDVTLILGVPGVFAPTGSAAWLLEHFGLTAQGIFDAALELKGSKG